MTRPQTKTWDTRCFLRSLCHSHIQLVTTKSGKGTRRRARRAGLCEVALVCGVVMSSLSGSSASNTGWGQPLRRLGKGMLLDTGCRLLPCGGGRFHVPPIARCILPLPTTGRGCVHGQQPGRSSKTEPVTLFGRKRAGVHPSPLARTWQVSYPPSESRQCFRLGVTSLPRRMTVSSVGDSPVRPWGGIHTPW